MEKDIIINKKNKTKEQKYNLINRFNKPLEEGPFLEIFQKVMIERLLLNKDKKYHPENVKRIIEKMGRDAKYMNTDISNGFILSTNVDAEFYILLQETIKEVTGNYMPMDAFIHILLTWFYQYYSSDINKKVCLPFVKKSNKRKRIMISKFNHNFSHFYKNI